MKKGQRPADAAAKFTDEHEIYQMLANKEPSGSYLVSKSGMWHGGIHITDTGAGTQLDLNQGVRCIADGHVIAYRVNRAYPVSQVPASSNQPASQALYSTGFALVRHTMEFPKGKTFTFYSVYMHLQAYDDYERDVGKSKPSYWSTQFKVTEHARDKPEVSRTGSAADPGQQGLTVRATPRGGQRGGHAMAILPQGACVSIGEQQHGWGKITDVHGAQLYAPQAGGVPPSTAVSGWIFLGNENGGPLVQAFMPDDTFDRVVVTASTLDSAGDASAQGIPIKAGDLIGHLGRYDSLNAGSSATRMAHIEAFCDDSVQTFIDQSRTWIGAHGAHKDDWTPLGLSAEPTILRIDTQTKLFHDAEREGASAPMTGVVQRWSLGELARDRNKQHVEQNADRTGRKVNWWRVGSADPRGQAIEGWVREEAFAGGRVTREFAQTWVDFSCIDDAHDPAHSMFATTQAWVDYAGHANVPHAKSLTKLSPMMRTIYRVLFPQGDGSGAADDMCVSYAGESGHYPWLMQRASRLIVKHESEWANPDKWKQLYAEIERVAGRTPQYDEEQKRIEKLVWWDEVKAKVSGFPGSDVFHINPIGLVANFEASNGCSCGCCYVDKFKVSRWSGQTVHYGPVYWGGVSLEASPAMRCLLSNGQMTQSEHRILVAMSKNEGKMDSVQAYDSEIFTAGACQKTVNIRGAGEFPIQVAEFKQENGAAYKRLFADCGWSVEDTGSKSPIATMFYSDESLTGGTLITGRELYSLVRTGCNAKAFGHVVSNKPLASIVNAVIDNEFQEKQVKDFVRRLRLVISIIPTGFTSTIGDFCRNDLGRALALDQHVNRPGNVADDFGRALSDFFHANSSVANDPAKWGAQHTAHEAALTAAYAARRRMNDNNTRYASLSGALSQ
ncbi:hypothetical protein YK56LOC_15250 [Caballeronia sp. HLA56]